MAQWWKRDSSCEVLPIGASNVTFTLVGSGPGTNPARIPLAPNRIRDGHLVQKIK